MALSASFDFTQDRDQLIKDCLTTAGVVRDDETPTGEMNASAARLLNRMLKAWTVHGLQLWTHKDCLLFLEDGKDEYELYSSGDRWILKQDATETLLNGALATSATAVTVDSTTGMTAADVIGIVTASNTMHWDTIASVDSSTTLTLTTGLAAAAADNAYVVAYTSKAQKPYRIIDANAIRYSSSELRVPMNIISREEYYQLGGRDGEGSTVNIHFLPEYDRGRLWIWPKSDSDAHRLEIVAQLPVDDMDISTSTFYFPDYWLDAIHTNLSYRLYIDYPRADGADPYDQKGRRLEKLADKCLTEAIEYDVEDTNVHMQPDHLLFMGTQ